jgi:DUF971 family protein
MTGGEMLDSLQVSDDFMHLQMIWADGSASVISAQNLRKEARDAVSVRTRFDQGVLDAPENLQITTMTQVGSTGVNIHFSDGHERAIYPFVYLKELSDRFDN